MTVTCVVRELAVYFVPVRFKSQYSVGGDRLVVSKQADQTDVSLRYQSLAFQYTYVCGFVKADSVFNLWMQSRQIQRCVKTQRGV